MMWNIRMTTEKLETAEITLHMDLNPDDNQIYALVAQPHPKPCAWLTANDLRILAGKMDNIEK